MRLSSKNLFHFTTKFEYLVSILKHGFEHRKVDEDLPIIFDFPQVMKGKFSFPVVCFCDIPEYAIRKHSLQYGRYGLCLLKSWGIKNHVTPIRYIHERTPDLDTNYMFSAIKDLYVILGDYNNQFSKMIFKMLNDTKNIPMPTETEWNSLPEKFRLYFDEIDKGILPIVQHKLQFLGLLRSHEGYWSDRVSGLQRKRSFYDEREWRSLETRERPGNLRFTSKDLVAILVPGNKDKLRLSGIINEIGFNNSNQFRNKILTMREFEEKFVG